MPLKTDRRTRLRKRPLSLVYVELPPSNGGMMRDLSEHGFSLRAMMPLRPSEKIPFSFALDTSARIDGEAIVLRVEDGGHVVALEFAGLPSHSRDQIRRWLDKFDEPLSPEPGPAQPKASKHASLTELRTQVRAPKSASSAPQVPESGPPPPPSNVTAPPRPESPLATVMPAVEITPPPPLKVTAPSPEPPLPPIASGPQPLLQQPEAATPKPELPPDPPPPQNPPARQSTELHPLPPLLKLSSVRPGPPPTEISVEPVTPVAIPKPLAELPARMQLSLPKMETPAAREERIPEPAPSPPVASRRVPPPALEPLSSLEGETDSMSPGWMDRFTLGRAIGIMLFLTLLAGSYVYHRELGQALIWLGREIAGEDSPETSKVPQPAVPSAHAIPKSSPPAGALPPPPLSIQRSPDSNEPRGANLPPASDKTPSPQLKGATPGSLVPLTQITRPPASSSPADNSAETGEQEHRQALQILSAPSRASEIPDAVRLLWVAVEKGNTGAEIDLAELFRKGRGVAKNCDQTRILLSAAARKGSVEARKRLEAFRREGCSD
jgi:hypothetical protein